MDLTREAKQYIELVASETLDELEKVAAAAKSQLRAPLAIGPDVLASVNTMTSGSTIQQMSEINQANIQSCQILAREPAIARVVVADDRGDHRTYYICRTMPVSGFQNLVSRNAPVGRLAALPIGSELTLPNGTTLEVLERARLRPLSHGDGWDSHNTVVEAHRFGPITIESLRTLLIEIAGTELTENLLEQLLAEENLKANIIEGLRRNVITKMGLRDQPILDQYQARYSACRSTSVC